jgi:hypothetical protein
MHWQPSLKNPIFDGDILFGKGYRTEDSKISKKGDIYYMFVSSARWTENMSIHVLWSKSLDGPWDKVQDEPIIITSSFFDFDYRYLRLGDIQYHDGNWYLYYAGQNFFKQDAVGVAIASDKDFPLGWKKYEKNPILKKAGNDWESTGILTLSVKKLGLPGKEWYGHYTGRGKDRKYNLGVCRAPSPLGPFERSKYNPILGGGNWDINGPARADIIQVGDIVYGAYECAGSKPIFQIGGYSADSLDGSFKKIFPNKPWLSGEDQGLQYANPCLWQENGLIYLLVARKSIDDYTPYWRYVDLFQLVK